METIRGISFAKPVEGNRVMNSSCPHTEIFMFEVKKQGPKFRGNKDSILRIGIESLTPKYKNLLNYLINFYS